MDKKIFSILFSTRLMAFLFIIFAIAMAVGTFVESSYNTDTARIWIYNAKWFEVIMAFFVINFIGNISRYQLYKKEKWATLMLHLSFIFILVGAFVTRYISFEGMMPIREGVTENQFYSDKTYLNILVDGDFNGEMVRKNIQKPMLFSPVVNNDFTFNDKFNTTPYTVSYVNYVMGATETIKADEKGTFYLKMVESGDGTRHEHFLEEGEVQNIHNVLFAFNNTTKGAINITKVGEQYTIQSPFDGNFMRMADQLKGGVVKDSIQPLMMRSLYNLGGAQFVFPEFAIKGVKEYVSNNDWKDKQTDDALTVEIESGGQKQMVTLLGSKGKMGEPKNVKVGTLDFTLFFGSRVYELPFKIRLNDFIADKYPGTEKSFSAFESKVTVIDKDNTFDARIFMNNILDYKGYRFFQASYQPDEKGTVLSVNHDFWGTWITYIGYFLLYFGLMAILFTKHSRFADIKHKLETIKNKKAKLVTLLAFMISTLGFSQNHDNHNHQPKKNTNFIDSILKYQVPKAEAAKFGELVIQDNGRMKPINTFSSELLRKVYKSDHFMGMNSDQVFLSMKQYPFIWFDIPLIHIKGSNDSIRKIIGVDISLKHVPFRSFFTDEGEYKLTPYLDDAYKAANPNQFEKDFIETDKKVNLLNSALLGNIVKIFPIPNDPNNKWVSNLELSETTGTALDTIKKAFPYYLETLTSATVTKDYKTPGLMLDGIKKFQKKHAGAIMPSVKKIQYEILYNKYDVFQKLPYWYLSLAVLMLFFTIVNIFKEKKTIDKIINGLHIGIGLLFATHTLALIVRWYISGHAPWSDAYESIIYVAWATMFFGLAFDRKSKLTVASGAFVTAMILAAAYAYWIDPAIGNLQPVLNSYWLMIHVAVIVASYGPFALGFILGFVSLLLIFFTTEKNKEKMSLNIQEITYINELALTIGLVMLSIGNFLGGQWANESWGRYWGWDPKETWALISIMIYAFVIHARFVPSFRGKWVFNLMSMFAFVSILFTYYGVNFHLVGLHSYASGEAKSLSWIYYTLGFIILIGLITYPKYKKYYKKSAIK